MLAWNFCDIIDAIKLKDLISSGLSSLLADECIMWNDDGKILNCIYKFRNINKEIRMYPRIIYGFISFTGCYSLVLMCNKLIQIKFLSI